ncbi:MULTISPECIES: MarR family winged helix-turn-helix transcriptional regulator [unclassified Mucilaginibacter]|uniref:MarR family winged helix-turn-helix transcriptional regulator n=1 Tax=unclassified Mucilaginibacter TaxID=2617802 RepID=UPI0031F6FD2C
MKSYGLVHQLLNLVEQFEKESNGSEISMQGFAGFLVNHLQDSAPNETTPDIRFGENEKEAQSQAYQIDNSIARLFIYMSRYAKYYIKKALEGTPLQTGEDFTCLAILLTHDNMSKGDLISRNLQEKTSGTEVIRRLITAGLVEQWNDDKDKRGKRICITDAGRELLYDVFKEMNNVGKIVTGELNLSEKLVLQHLLQKLESFHYHHHEKKTINSKRDLQEFNS